MPPKKQYNITKKPAELTHKEDTLAKPIIKWVGGKTQILEKVLNKLPKEINNYYEIFLGGGSVLLGLLELIHNNKIKVNGSIYAFDLNETLINLYKNIQINHKELYRQLQVLIEEYNNISSGSIGANSSLRTGDVEDEIKTDNILETEEKAEETKVKKINRKPTNIDDAKTSKETYYYWIRSRYNNLSQQDKNSFLGSAMFIFLNKTCFRGVYRMGPNGFNVPYGNYNNPEIINYDNLEKVSTLIQNVIFTTSDYKNSTARINSNDFVYLDPPYAPINNTSFVGYNDGGFSLANHNDLFELCKTFTRKKIKFLMSNADVELVRANFPTPEYNTQIIECKRSINAKNPGSKCNEVLINNY